MCICKFTPVRYSTSAEIVDDVAGGMGKKEARMHVAQHRAYILTAVRTSPDITLTLSLCIQITG